MLVGRLTSQICQNMPKRVCVGNAWRTQWKTRAATVGAKCQWRYSTIYVLLSGPCANNLKMPSFGRFNAVQKRNSGTWQDQRLKLGGPVLSFYNHMQKNIEKCLFQNVACPTPYYVLAGYPLCREQWAFLLGVGKHRLVRCRNTFQGRDARSMTGPGGYLPNNKQFLFILHFYVINACTQRLYLSKWIAHFSWSLHGSLTSSGPAAPPAEKAASVTSFLIHLYWSAAESMPTECLWSNKVGVQDYNYILSCKFLYSISLLINLLINNKSIVKSWKPQDVHNEYCSWPHVPRMLSKENLKISSGDQQFREDLLQRLIDVRLMSAFTQVGFNADPRRLALRELPHGNWSNVYLLYQAHCKAAHEVPASKSTFFSVALQWKCCLRFHKKSQHAVCATCSRLKMRLRNVKESWNHLGKNWKQIENTGLATVISRSCLGCLCPKDVQLHCQLSEKLLEHYAKTLEDRKTYWAARERSKSVGDLLTIIVDSYDKAKVVLPRWPFQRCPKRSYYEQVRRQLSALECHSFWIWFIHDFLLNYSHWPWSHVYSISGTLYPT